MTWSWYRVHWVIVSQNVARFLFKMSFLYFFTVDSKNRTVMWEKINCKIFLLIGGSCMQERVEVLLSCLRKEYQLLKMIQCIYIYSLSLPLSLNLFLNKHSNKNKKMGRQLRHHQKWQIQVVFFLILIRTSNF